MVAAGYEVRLSSQALGHLRGISAHIAQHSPQNAASMIARLLEAIDDLEFMPERFRVVGRSRTRGNNVHARVVQPYIIYYHVDRIARKVFVVQIRHGAQRQPRSF
jgi:plasmid stabilization system protein ParE